MSDLLYSIGTDDGRELLFEKEENFISSLKIMLMNNGKLLKQGHKQIIIVRMVMNESN